jgi:hypothetical protein
MVGRAFSISTLTFCLAALSPATAFAQTSAQTSPDVSSAVTPAAEAAHVYVGTTKGVYLYSAASNGSLSLVSGSPFSIAGNAVGSNGKYFLSLGTNYLHSYPVASNGAIKGQASQINTAPYRNGECGAQTTFGGTIDRTGTEAYIQFEFLGTYDEGCDSLQSYKIDAASGAFTFNGIAEFSGDKSQALGGPLVIAGNNSHAYAFPKYYCNNFFQPFYRDRFGAMNVASFSVTYPPPPPGEGPSYYPLAMASDNQNLSTSHMAVALEYIDDPPCYSSLPPALASYTVDSSGNLFYNGATLKPAINPTSMAITPQGNLLAVGGASSDPILTKYGPGLQVFHFNGANPITSYSGILTTAPIDTVLWDSRNHLYALSKSTKKLYAYTVTSTSITAVPGSPYTIASTPNALIVVPTSATCSAPGSPGVNICSPSSGSTVSSPVNVQAVSAITGTLARVELWVDGVKKYTETSSTTLNTSLSLGAGGHRFTVIAVNTAGTKWQAVSTATVK